MNTVLTTRLNRTGDVDGTPHGPGPRG
jgi:hypothetical protein